MWSFYGPSRIRLCFEAATMNHVETSRGRSTRHTCMPHSRAPRGEGKGGWNTKGSSNAATSDRSCPVAIATSCNQETGITRTTERCRKRGVFVCRQPTQMHGKLRWKRGFRGRVFQNLAAEISQDRCIVLATGTGEDQTRKIFVDRLHATSTRLVIRCNMRIMS